MRTLARLVAVVALTTLIPVAPAAQSPEQLAVLNRATLWVAQFVQNYSNVVAEELYDQETTSPRRRRRLRSDYMLVMFPGTQLWHTFRDTIEVDGKMLPDEGRAEQLARLFVEPADNAVRRAQEIGRASSRYNLIDIGTLNDPLRVLAYLQEGYRGSFRFVFSGIDRDLGPSVRTVRFEERGSPTIIKRGGAMSGTDFPSYGLIWIDEPTGRILKTQLRPGRFSNPSTVITTTFRTDERLGIDVPAEMRDVYPDRTGEMHGVATYGRFRRYQANAQEAIDIPPNPR